MDKRDAIGWVLVATFFIVGALAVYYGEYVDAAKILSAAVGLVAILVIVKRAALDRR